MPSRCEEYLKSVQKCSNRRDIFITMHSKYSVLKMRAFILVIQGISLEDCWIFVWSLWLTSQVINKWMPSCIFLKDTLNVYCENPGCTFRIIEDDLLALKIPKLKYVGDTKHETAASSWWYLYFNNDHLSLSTFLLPLST